MKALVTYFTMAYFFSWLIWFPLYSPIFRIQYLPKFSFQHALGGLGPLLSSFVCTRIFEKKKGVAILWKSMWKVKPMLYLFISVFSPFVLVLLSLFIAFLIDSKPIEFSKITLSKEFSQFNFLAFSIYNLLFFGFGEEVGWRGFALPRFQKNFGNLFSTFLLAIFWAVWHFPLFLYRPGYLSMDIFGILGWLLSLFTGSVLLTWLYNSSKGSLFICAIFHSTIDIVFLTDFKNQNIINYLGMFITIWGLLTIFWFGHKKLPSENVHLKF